jgi:hypothetical protein
MGGPAVSPPGADTRARLNLTAIETALRDVQRGFDLVNSGLAVRREPLDDRVIDNMMDAYALVDLLVADGIDLFAMGNLKFLLEFNTRVLCGTNPARREAYARHTEATEHRFYEDREAGVRDVIEWHESHRDDPVWDRAAGVYVRILTAPQLFIEGNHRTGAAIMSYILVHGGEPPFVLSAANAAAYFDPSTTIKDIHKSSGAMVFRLPAIRKRLAALLRESADRRYLLP